MCVELFSAKEHEQKQADSHVDRQEVGLIINDSVLGVAQVTDFAGGAILGQQDIASVQILVHQQPVVHLGQASCHLLQHHHHLLSPKPAVQVKSLSDTSGLAFAGSASSTVARLKHCQHHTAGCIAKSAQNLRPGCRQGAETPMYCQSALYMIQHNT